MREAAAIRIRVGLALVATLVMASLLATSGFGLAQAPELSLSAQESSLEVDPNASTTSTIVVENTGSTDGTAQLSAEEGTEGWGFALSEDEVTVPAGGSQTVELTVSAPVDRDAGPLEGTVTVEGTMEDATGQFTSSDELEVAAAMPPAPPPPAEPMPWGWIAGASGAFVLVAGIGTGAYLRRSIDSGVEITLERDACVRPGGEQVVPISLANTSEDDRGATLRLETLPREWGGGVNRDEITLPAGEEDEIWVALKPSEDAEEGSHDVVLGVDYASDRVLSDEARLPVVVDGSAPDADRPGLIAPVGARPVDSAIEGDGLDAA